jgi:c(7)-type cytochrome triheme protein
MIKLTLSFGAAIPEPKAVKEPSEVDLSSSHPLRRILQLLVIVCVAVLAACSSPSPLLALLFDIPSAGKDTANAPVVRGPRHVPFKGVAPLTVSKEYKEAAEAMAKLGPPPDWPAIFKKLPKDDDDNIAWMVALANKVITPSAGIDPATPQPEVQDMDVELSTSGKPARMVVFSHQVHTTWLRCNNCHPAIFEKDAGSAKITMAAIDDGKYCGVCHDKVAIAPDGCKGCHKGVKKS